jgi:hypothetical protein
MEDIAGDDNEEHFSDDGVPIDAERSDNDSDDDSQSSPFEAKAQPVVPVKKKSADFPKMLATTKPERKAASKAKDRIKDNFATEKGSSHTSQLHKRQKTSAENNYHRSSITPTKFQAGPTETEDDNIYHTSVLQKMDDRFNVKLQKIEEE